MYNLPALQDCINEPKIYHLAFGAWTCYMPSVLEIQRKPEADADLVERDAMQWKIA